MKFTIFLLSFFCLALQGIAQREVSLELVKDTDSTFLISQSEMDDGKWLSGSVLPADGNALKSGEFKAYIIGLINTENERAEELERLQIQSTKNLKLLASAIDSVAGKGAYDALMTEKLKSELQGEWVIFVRAPGVDKVIIKANISGDNVTTKDKTALIVWGPKAFTLNKGVFTSNLRFTKSQGRYVAEKADAAGAVTKYILRKR